MGIFGWSYPAGCSGPPDDDATCEVCGVEAGSCTCPVCPVCETQGDPKCYEEHGLKRTEPPREQDFDAPNEVGGYQDFPEDLWDGPDDTDKFGY